MLRNKVKNIIAAIIAAGLLGCTQQVTTLDQNWGRSHESARFNQIMNPETEKNQDLVEGLTGPAAERVMESYLNGKTNKQKPLTEFGVVTIKK